jgi:cytochrome P450
MTTDFSLLNILEDKYKDNPYPLYHQLRSQHHIFWDERLNAWVLTRYQDVAEALKNPQLSNQRLSLEKSSFPEKFQDLVEESLKIIQKQMIFNDSTVHGRLKGVWSSIFSSKVLESLIEQIKSMTENLLNQALSQFGKKFDFMSSVAFPLVSNIIYTLIDVDTEEFPEFANWIINYINFLDGKIQFNKDVLRTLKSVSCLHYACSNIIERRLKYPKNDLLQNVISEINKQHLSLDELAANMILLIAAGHQSSAHLIGVALLALYQHPYYYQEIIHDYRLIPSLVTESLRYDSPIQTIGRFAKNNLELCGHNIKAGQKIMMSIGSANRDPERFENPDLFIIHRSDNVPLSFGFGAHQCIGAALSKLEAKVVIETVLTHLPRLQINVNELNWDVGIASRGLNKLILNID